MSEARRGEIADMMKSNLRWPARVGAAVFFFFCCTINGFAQGVLPPIGDAASVGAITDALPPPAPLGGAPGATAPSVALRADFVRGVVVEARGPALRSPEAIKKLVADCRSRGIDTIVAQVRSHGDALYKSGHVPMDSALAAGFDPLATLLQEARQGGQPVRVMAMMTMLRVWSDKLGEAPFNHVVRKHPEWLTQFPEGGKQMAGEAAESWLDPGVTPVQDYLALVVTDLVANYAVDGVVLDRMRYPDTDLRSGYNPIAVELFNRSRQSSEIPAPQEAVWVNWRRSQLTEVMRKISTSAHAARAGVTIAVGSVTYGQPPANMEQWKNESVPYTRVLSDWAGWCEAGLVDANLLLDYKPADSKGEEFAGWWNFALQNKGKAKLWLGVGGWLNASRDTAAALAAGALQPATDGVVLYNYANAARADEPDGMAWTVIAKGFNAQTVAAVSSAAGSTGLNEINAATLPATLTSISTALLHGALTTGTNPAPVAATPAFMAPASPTTPPIISGSAATPPAALPPVRFQTPVFSPQPTVADPVNNAPVPSLSDLGRQQGGAPLPGQAPAALPPGTEMPLQPLQPQPGEPVDPALDSALQPANPEQRRYITPAYLLPSPTPVGTPRPKGESNWGGNPMPGANPTLKPFVAPNVLDVKPQQGEIQDPAAQPQNPGPMGNEYLPEMSMDGGPAPARMATPSGIGSAPEQSQLPGYDMIRLKNGKSFQGLIMQEGKQVQIKLPTGGIITLPSARVEEIQKGPPAEGGMPR
ncbi:hypothetical protein CVU37_04200 [candidate division BRC1 bacterium HGW-BRC1-1]|nr:MAG: hypothetical protein CVU37_04200 [candidate division BRC1 bacterium HGW-BRC1-1]